MLKNNDKITNGQMSAIIINIILGVGILSLPRILVESLKTDGWVLVIVGGLLSITFVVIITKLSQMFPGKTIVEFGRGLVTPPISAIFSITYLAYFFVLGSFVVRVFGEMVKMYLLPKTPIEFIIISILIVCTYLARAGIEAIGKFSVILIPIVIVPIFLMGVILLPNMDFTNVLPVFQFKLTDLIKGIPDVFFSFAGFEVILLFVAYVEKPQKAIKYNAIAILIVTVLYMYAFLTNIFVFGEAELTHLIWPSMSLMETIDFPGAFIENVQGVVMGQWVLIVFSTLTPVLYGSALILCKLFKGKEHNYFVLPMVPIMFILSLVPQNIAETYEYINQAMYYLGAAVTIVIPILLLIVALLKKGKKKGGMSNG